MTYNQITGLYVIALIVVTVVLLVALLHRRPFDLKAAERTTEEYRRGLYLLKPSEVNFVQFLPMYPWLGCSAPVWTSLLLAFGYVSEAFMLLFSLFCFGLMSTRALETSGRPSRLHYISCTLTFLSILLWCWYVS